jgi:hypothetical protein
MMGVKSTKILTRLEAEDKYYELQARLDERPILPWNDETLENILERMNDEVNGGDGFENYSIREWP